MNTGASIGLLYEKTQICLQQKGDTMYASDTHGMTVEEYNQALSFDWRDLRIETLERELLIQKQEHAKDILFLKEDAEYWFKEYQNIKAKYLKTLDHKIFS